MAEGRQLDWRWRAGSGCELMDGELGELAAIRRWAEAYLGRRFGGSRRSRAPAAWQALDDDAIQHLLESVVRGKARSIAEDNVPAFVTWCKRVLDNFVISELRLQSRPPLPTDPAQAPDPHSIVEARELVERLVGLLRSHVEQSARPHHVQGRLALLDEFLALPLQARGGVRDEPLSDRDEPLRDRDYQRRCRGRQLASRAWAELRGSSPACADLQEVATALGLGFLP